MYKICCNTEEGFKLIVDDDRPDSKNKYTDLEIKAHVENLLEMGVRMVITESDLEDYNIPIGLFETKPLDFNSSEVYMELEADFHFRETRITEFLDADPAEGITEFKHANLLGEE